MAGRAEDKGYEGIDGPDAEVARQDGEEGQLHNELSTWGREEGLVGERRKREGELIVKRAF